jgi:hypothetical protein
MPLCEHDHLCPACFVGQPCLDLFHDPVCGLVACMTDAEPSPDSTSLLRIEGRQQP